MKHNPDAEQLRLLSIFHFVIAGIVALFSLFPILHLLIGVAIVTGTLDTIEKGNPPPAFVGWLFVIIPLVVILSGLTLAICIALAGLRLAQMRSYTFCLVVAGIECIFMPLGTVLGAFTIVVLTRPGVREMFGEMPFRH